MKTKNKEVIEDIGESETSSIELNDKKVIEETPIKTKKPYVLTDARKLAFEPAREKRQVNIDLRKQQQQLLVDEQEAIKQAVIDKRNRKLIKKNKKEIKKIIQNEDLFSSSDEEEIIIKKKRHPPKKVIYIESESDENEPQHYKNVPKTPVITQREPPRRIIQYY